jgi:hypothetical protein
MKNSKEEATYGKDNRRIVIKISLGEFETSHPIQSELLT